MKKFSVVALLLLNLAVASLLLNAGIVFAQSAPTPLLNKASQITTDTTHFNNNLSPTDTTVQKALDTLDNLSASAAGVTDVTASSPLSSSGGSTPNITIQNAAADGSTKGAASFASADFNASTGNISLDYVNGQAASGSANGFLSSTDWTTFNSKQDTVTWGAGLSASGSTASTASDEADFVKSGALTCGAATQGKVKVHTTPLQYCDNAATPTLQYAAYGSSTGVATLATALNANPANCSAGSYPLGVDASGVTESCTVAASTAADYITGSAQSTLSAEQSLGALTTGLLLNTSSAGTGTLSQYAGTSCTNQFPRSLSASGAATCASVAIASDVSGLGSGVATFLATPTSANLAAAITNETGTLLSVFSDSPVFTTKITTPVMVSAAGDPADAGAIRLGNGELIEWEANPTGTDLTAGMDSNNVFSTSVAINATTGFRIGNAAASGKFLVGNGTNYVASTSTIPTSAGSTANKLLKSDGTNYVLSTTTFPDASATVGKAIVSDGTNWIASTPTFPNASATSGKFIRSDGTNWIASTPTLPTTAGTSGNLLVSDGTNFLSSNPFIFNEVPSGTINSTNVTFTIANTPRSGTVQLYQNGLRLLVGTDYTISGATITMTSAPITNDTLLTDYLK